jgi:hypothetical protein
MPQINLLSIPSFLPLIQIICIRLLASDFWSRERRFESVTDVQPNEFSTGEVLPTGKICGESPQKSPQSIFAEK